MPRALAPSLLCVVLLIGCTSTPTSPSPSAASSPAGSATDTPQTVTPTSATPGPRTAAILVRGSAREIGERVLIAPGPNGGLFVAIPSFGGSVLGLLDAGGRLQAGWPIRVPGAPSCGLLLPVDDGSVRVVCNADDLPGEFTGFSEAPVRAFAFDPGGRPLPGWPVDLPCCFIGRVVEDTLTVYGREISPDSVDGWIVSVAADGSVRNGERVTYAHCCEDIWAVGPDGVAYGAVLHPGEAPAASTSELAAVGPTGVPGGFPIAIDGIASEPAFDESGRIHVIVGIPFEPPSRTLTFSQRGRAVEAGAGEFDLAAPSEFAGIEGSALPPAPPLVGLDGTTFLIEISKVGTTVAGVSALGEVMAGWPYRSDAVTQSTGVCPEGTTCEGSFWALPAIGPDNGIHLIHAASDPATAGGSIVAVDPEGKVRPGWPVELQGPGGEFWSVVVGLDGTAFALAIEPEAGDESSASILALGADATVRYTTTIIEP